MSLQRWRFTDALNFSVAFVIRDTFNAAELGLSMEMERLTNPTDGASLAGDISLTAKEHRPGPDPHFDSSGDHGPRCRYGVQMERVIILKLDLPEQPYPAFVCSSRSVSADTS